jgi:hypothetical protein
MSRSLFTASASSLFIQSVKVFKAQMRKSSVAIGDFLEGGLTCRCTAHPSNSKLHWR